MKSFTLKTVVAIFMYAFCVGCAAAPPLKDVSYSPQFDFPPSKQKYELKSAVYISPAFVNTNAISTFNSKDSKNPYIKARIDVGKSAEEVITTVLKTMFLSVDFYYDQNYVPGCDKYDVVFDGEIAASPLRGMNATCLEQETTVALLVRCPDAYPSKQEFDGKSTTMFPHPGKEKLSITKGQEVAKTLTELSLKNALGEMFGKLENSSELSKIAKNPVTDDTQISFNTYDSVTDNEMVKKEVQKRLDAQSGNDFAKTIGQSVAIGAAGGAVIGGAKDKSLAGLLVGAAVGAVGGLVVGSAVAATKQLYVGKEDELDEKINLANTHNRGQMRYNRMQASKIRIINDEVNSLSTQYATGTIQFDDMQKMRDEVLSEISCSEQCKIIMEKELVALNEYFVSVKETKQKDKQDKLANLTQEINSLRASIDILDTNTKQLALMVDELSSVRK